MEITTIMESANYEKYESAKERVRELKGFYKHVIVYVIINIAIIVGRLVTIHYVDNHIHDLGFKSWLDWNIFLTPVLWGIGLAAHGIKVYRHRFKLFKKWEDRKVQEYMDKEENEINQNWD